MRSRCNDGRSATRQHRADRRARVRPRLLSRRGLGAVLLAMALIATRPARAVDCTTLRDPVYVAGSTAAKPILAAVGKMLSAQAQPVTIVYLGQGSCAGVDAILNGTVLRGSGTTAASTWDSTGVESKCDIPTAGKTVAADVGVSDVFPTTCFVLPGGLPTNVQDFLGPVQTMTFVVPSASPERSISAEAAYYVFGFGGNSGARPWIDETWILHRDDQSGTQRMIAAAIGVGPDKWKGVVATSSSDLLSRLTASGTGGQTLGILAADVAQNNRSAVNILAYQHFGQTCGYFPDRDATTNEKINVRDGHYAIWGPVHLLTRVTTAGYPANSAAGDVIGYVTGTKVAPPGLDLIAIEAQSHVVPQCAMRVKRVQEMGPLASYAPPGACGCYYDKVANGITTCQACTSPNDCPASRPICGYGYCETQ